MNNALTLSLARPAAGRLALLDELKGFAILLVVLYHAGGVLGWENRLHGQVGVDIFVLLSGVGLTLSSADLDMAGFLKRRLFRIYPTYWVVLTALILASGHWLGRKYTGTDVILHYTGIHAFFGDRYALSISDPLWFITLILLCYVLYLCVRRWLQRSDIVLCLGLGIGFVLAYVYFKASQPVTFSHFAMRVPLFFLGLVWGTAVRTGSVEVRFTPWLGLGILSLTYIPYLQGIVFANVLIAPGLMALYALLWRPAMIGPLSHINAVFAFLGRHSFEIFLLHQPLIRDYNLLVLTRWLGRVPDNSEITRGMAAAFLITLALSWILRRLYLLLFPSRSHP